MSSLGRAIERAEIVADWANLYGSDLAGVLRLDEEDEFDAELVAAIDRALHLVSEIYALAAEIDKMKAALELIAMPCRPDGSYNRSREACEQLARAVLESL